MLLRTIVGTFALCGAISLAASGFAQTTPAPAAGTAAPAATAPATPPPIPVPFQDAVAKAANDLFSSAVIPEGAPEKIEVVIDPLIDGKTGAQTQATQSTEQRITELVRSKYPRFEIQPFTTAALDRKPLLLIGTLTPVNNAGEADGPKDAYAIWFKLADLKTNTILSMGRARAAPVGVNMTPSAYFADSPVWTNDPTIQAYIKSCQGTKPGEQLDQAYVDQLRAAALIKEGIAAYDAGRYEEALRLYEEAASTPGGDQLRAHNGIYLANWKLGRTEEAAAAFAKIVDYGLSHDRLAVKFLFQVGSADFFGNPDLTAPYPIWIDQIAARTAENAACLQLVGHTSRTGPEAFNNQLSILRAERIRELLTQQTPDLETKLAVDGVGWRENIIGTG